MESTSVIKIVNTLQFGARLNKCETQRTGQNSSMPLVPKGLGRLPLVYFFSKTVFCFLFFSSSPSSVMSWQKRHYWVQQKLALAFELPEQKVREAMDEHWQELQVRFSIIASTESCRISSCHLNLHLEFSGSANLVLPKIQSCLPPLVICCFFATIIRCSW